MAFRPAEPAGGPATCVTLPAVTTGLEGTRVRAQPAPSARRILLASLIGTAVEFYDFYIYATAASLVFGPLFFPASSASMQLLAAIWIGPTQHRD